MTSNENTKQAWPVAIFDSGVGGLSVLRELRKRLPGEDYLYFGDQINVPYGPRGLEEVRGLSEAIVRFLLAQDVKLIVIACNTASAAALKALREAHPEVPFVGLEPALKPAVEHTETGVVGVLATPTTFEGPLYESVVERFAGDVTILKSTCPGLAAEIEAGRWNGVVAERILREALEPMLPQGLDTVVLGCTHYPFAFETIQKITGPNVRMIDPAPAIALRVQSLLAERALLNAREGEGAVRYLTSGQAEQMALRVEQLLGEKAEAEALHWQDGELRR
jgi:glutamate racemase